MRLSCFPGNPPLVGQGNCKRGGNDDHLPLEGGGRPAPAGREGVTALQPLPYRGGGHPTPDCLRQSDPPPSGEGVNTRFPMFVATSDSYGRGHGASSPPAFFQASRPPSMWQAAVRPASCAACTAMAERSPKAQ